VGGSCGEGKGKGKKGEFGLDIKTANVGSVLEAGRHEFFFLRLIILARKEWKEKKWSN